MAESRLSIVIDSRSAEQKAQDVKRALQALEDAGVRVTGVNGNVANSMAQQARQAQNLAGRLQGTKGAMDRMAQAQNAIRSGQKGLFQPVQAQRYTESVDKAADASRRAAQGYRRAGLSAKELQQAQRQLPMQFTDIFTSLAAGQPPLQVFLQQGGQLKDVFGGIGPAFRGMAGYIAGLINPLTLAAGSMGALVLAYEQGADEQREFQKTLTLTGNQAGTTSGELMMLAEQMDSLANTTQGKAAAALNTVVRSGKFTANQFRMVTETALMMQNATGQAIDDTIEQFGKIAEDPVDGIVELNEQYSFLTEETYNQIAALEQAGRTTEAQRVAMNEYADTMQDRASDISKNLGWIKDGWNLITSAATESWNAMLDVGRKDTISQRVQGLKKTLEDAQSMTVSYGAVGAGNARGKERIAGIRAELASLQALQSAIEAGTLAQNKQNEATQAAIDASERERKLVEENRVAKQKIADIDREIAFLRERAASAESSDRRQSIQSAIEGLQQERQSVVETTEAYRRSEEAQKAAAKAAEQAEERRQRALEESQKAYSSLMASLSPVGAAQAEYARTVQQLAVAYEEGRKNALEYYAAVSQAAIDYNEAVSEATRSTESVADAYDRTSTEVSRGAKDLGFAFQSAFEEAVVSGNGLRDVLSGLLEDIAKLTLRQSVTGPMANFVSTAASSYFGGAPVDGGWTSQVAAGGYANGGYTGDGGRLEPAGVVHRGEFVVQKSVVDNPGVRPMLERLNKGYADGGYVGPSIGATVSPGVVVNVHTDGDAQVSQKESRQSDGTRQLDLYIERKVEGSVNRMFASGQMDRTMRKFGARRQSNG